jgi:hypothetical protein
MNPRGFIEKLVDIARISRSFTARHHSTSEGFTVSLRFIEPSPHSDLGVHLAFNANDKSRIAIEIRAREWSPTDSPSYETYCAAATTMMKPLLARYNREERTRYRMRITPKQKLEPNLSPLSAKLFNHFITNANISNLHYRDWRRFYEFVRVSPPRLSESDVRFLLIKEGFSEQHALHIATIYNHLRDFKRPRDAAETIEQYHVRKTGLAENGPRNKKPGTTARLRRRQIA